MGYISSPESPERQIAAMMPLSDILDEDGYTDLHCALIGFLPLDLQTALANPVFKLQVNHKTVDGITPLHLAARNCPNGTEAQLLLSAGADPDAAAYNGATPLNWACLGGSEKVVEVLLSAGASPQLCTILHETPLHAAARCENSGASMIDMLLEPEYELDIDAANHHELTPVALATTWNSLTALKHLVARRANMDTPDKDGDTPLHNAIFHMAHGVVRLLVGLQEKDPAGDDIGGDSFKVGGIRERYCSVNHSRGWGILHYLADLGDKEMMEDFTRVGMTGPDPETFTDLQGKTAVDIFRNRVGVDVGGGYGPVAMGDNGGQEEQKELVQAWRNLLASINIETGETSEDDNGSGGNGMGRDGGDDNDLADSSDDEFHDAQEDRTQGS